MVWNYLSPNLMSNIWWMGTLYIVYIIFIILEIIALLSERMRNAATLGLVGAFFGIIATSNLGGVFATLTARPYWHGPFIPIFLILSAFVSGSAVALFFTYVSYRLRGMDFDEKITNSLSAVAKLLTLFLFALLFFYWWKMITGVFNFPLGAHESTMALLFGPLSFNFWVFEIFLGVALPISLLLSTKLRNVKAMFWASVSCLVGLFVMRYDMVVIDQLTPVWQSIGVKGYETYATYFPSPTEMVIVGTGFGFCMLFYLVAERFLILDEVHEEPTEELTEEEARVLTLAEEVRAKRKGKIEGPWQLEARMKPREPKTVRLDRAREILNESDEKE
jgi:molybdopterin-containing oxidoreductase family membrane subunit